MNFSTDFGTFGENGLPLVSIVTTNGTAVAALCGPSAGTAKVKGTVTIASKTNSGQLNITFQGEGALPFVTYCSPSFGPKEGGTSVTLNGGRLFGAPSTTRVTFTVNGVSKDGLVTSVTSNAVTVTTPGFPEVAAPTALAPITLTLGTNSPQPVVLSLPTCFSYGAQDAGTPTVTAVLPASGAKSGNTRVTIVGSGFSTSGVQVFFGTVEATVVSVSFNQVVALSPPAPFGETDFAAPVTVKNINSGIVSNFVLFTYTPDMHITAIANGVQSTDAPFTPVTIYGTGFQAPVVVTLAGIQAFVQSVSATELTVMPGIPAGCGGGGSGSVVVTSITTGETATSPAGVTFTYVVVPMTVVVAGPAGRALRSVRRDRRPEPAHFACQRAGPVRRARGTGQLGLRDGAHGHRPSRHGDDSADLHGLQRRRHAADRGVGPRVGQEPRKFLRRDGTALRIPAALRRPGAVGITAAPSGGRRFHRHRG